MARYEDSSFLFGVGSGDSTDGEIICDVCGNVYNKGISTDEDGDNDIEFGESVRYQDFGELQVCECCFEKIETAVLVNIEDILKWYRRIIQARKNNIQKSEKLLNEVIE
jgi:hypothetical protein